MKQLNRNQILGIAFLVIGITAGHLFDSSFIGVPAGVLAAVGVSLILKWMPFKKPQV